MRSSKRRQGETDLLEYDRAIGYYEKAPNVIKIVHSAIFLLL
jgi:hypothetical protein